MGAALAVCLLVAGGSHVFAAPGDSVNVDAGEQADVGSLDGTDLDVFQGKDAVVRLEETDTLVEVATNAGLEPHELANELLDDSSMFVTDSGFVGYADMLEASPSSAATLTAAVPANVFALESRPTSSRVLYLDFDGHAANDPEWGGAGYPGVITSAPVDNDGVPATPPPSRRRSSRCGNASPRTIAHSTSTSALATPASRGCGVRRSPIRPMDNGWSSRPRTSRARWV